MESLYLLCYVSRISVIQQISLHISSYKSLEGLVNVQGVRETFFFSTKMLPMSNRVIRSCFVSSCASEAI